MHYKQPVSTLVIIHTPDLQVLLLERADRPGYWQSVTGSREGDESLVDTARREVREETGLEADAFELTDWQRWVDYEIWPQWAHRYRPGTTTNREHVFGLQLPQPLPVRLAPDEHLAYVWLPWQLAADKAFSPSNAAAIRELPARLAASGG